MRIATATVSKDSSLAVKSAIILAVISIFVGAAIGYMTNTLVLSIAGGLCCGMLLGWLLFGFLTSGLITIREVECFFSEPTVKTDGSGKCQIELMLNGTNPDKSKVNLVSLRQVLLNLVSLILKEKGNFLIVLPTEAGAELRMESSRWGNYGMLITSLTVEIETSVEQAAAMFADFGFKKLAKKS